MFGVPKIMAETVKHDSPFSVSVDFRSMSIAQANALGFETNNLVTDAHGHKDYGAVTGEKWEACVTGGNASVTYKLSAEEGYVLNDARLSFEVGAGHAGGVYWYNKTGTLGANLTVYVSKNNLTWVEVFDLDSQTGKLKTNESASSEGGLYSNESAPIAIDDYLSNARNCYIKFDIRHFSVEEAIEAQPLVSSWASSGILLGKLGFCLYKINISSNSVEGVGQDNGIMIKNDFKNEGVVSSFAGIYSYKGLARDNNGNKTFPLVPAKGWGDPVTSCTGELVYKMSADEGFVFDETVITPRFVCYAYNDSFSEGKADFIVELSRDLISWDKVYSSFDKRGVKKTSEWFTEEIDVTEYANGLSVLYVKIIMLCPEVEGVYLGRLPVMLDTITLSATQKENEQGESATLTFGANKGGELASNFNGIVKSEGLYDGNATFGLIPSSGWNSTIEAGNGYFVYKMSAPAGKMYANASLKANYKLLEGANLRISYGYDNVAFEEYFDAAAVQGAEAFNNNLSFTAGSTKVNYRELNINLYDIVRNKSEVYLKIEIDHPAGSYSLFSLKFGMYSFRVESSYTDYIEKNNINYRLNGGSYKSGERNPSEFTSETPAITLINPEKRYSTFLGWYESADFNGSPVKTINTASGRDYTLYARWEEKVCTLHFSLIGGGTVTDLATGSEMKTGDYKVSAGSKLSVKLAAKEGYIIYGLKVNGTDMFLTGGSYTINDINDDYTIEARFNARETLRGDFSVSYRDSGKYQNEWKEGLYDYDNLYITDDAYHALGNDKGIGYVTYKFVPKDDDLTFCSAQLTFVAKLNDYLGMLTNERVDYYVGYDGVNYELVYKSPLNRLSNNVVTTSLNISEFVFGKKEFYLKAEVGSNSANWTLLYAMDMQFTYQTVEVTVNYGDYEEATYTQYKGKPFDSSVVSPANGYKLLSDKIYTDPERTTELDLSKPVTGDIKVYVKTEKIESKNAVKYELNGGVNSHLNPDYYDSDKGAVLYAAEREGHIFVGWFADAACTLRVIEISAGREGEITLHAKWIKNEVPDLPIEWTIAYELNGGENDSSNPATYRTGTAAELKAASKEGYTFLGWYKDSQFTVKAERIEADFKGDVTLYAKWQKNDEPDNPDKPDKPDNPDKPENPETPQSCGCSSGVAAATPLLLLAAAGAALVLLRRRKD